jgi:hypothetical protein
MRTVAADGWCADARVLFVKSNNLTAGFNAFFLYKVYRIEIIILFG